MPYIASDGTVRDNRPWSVSRLVGMFWGFVDFVSAFFRTLIPGIEDSTAGAGRSNDGSGRGPPRPPRRFGGKTMTMADCVVPGGG